MSKHTDELRFGIKISQDAAGDVEVAARQGKGVDFRAVEYSDVINEIGSVTLRGQFLDQPFHIGLKARVGVGLVALEYLSVVLAPECDLLIFTHEYQIATAGRRV